MERYAQLPDGTEIPVQEVNGSIRSVGEKSGNLISYAIRHWMSEQFLYL